MQGRMKRHQLSKEEISEILSEAQVGRIATQNGNGWEIDHIKPVAKGGGDELSNLQPLQWQNNRKKGDDFPASDYCIVSAK